MTSLSVFIREQVVQHVVVHALGSRMFARAPHGVSQAFARHTLPAGVALGRNHHHRRTAIAGDADGLALGFSGYLVRHDEARQEVLGKR